MSARRAAAHFNRYREWQWIKHLVLQDYLWPWAHKLGSIANGIYVVDAFAGAGTYRNRDDVPASGSPLIAAEVAIQYNAKFPNRQMRLICVERDRDNFTSLNNAMDRYRSIATMLQGDFVDHQEYILRAIGDAPALILLDPFGTKDITADRCRPLLDRVAKTDVFVIVIMSGIHRTVGQMARDGTPNPVIATAQRNLDNTTAFFGTDEWKRIALEATWNRERRERAYLNLYFANVLGRRYRYKSAYPVRAQVGGAIKYWLVSASAHVDAMWLMNGCIVKVDEIMLGQHFQPPGFLPGLGSGAVEAYREEVERQLAGAVLDQIRRDNPSSLSRITTALLSEFFGRVKKGAYAQIIKALVRNGKVTREERPAAALKPTERLWARD